jgi:hypothetical protein
MDSIGVEGGILRGMQAGAPEDDSCPHGSDGRWFEVRSSRFSQLRTQNFELRIAPVALFPPVSPVSLILSSARFNR